MNDTFLKEKPYIQILLATYNGELFLREQLDSIFSQTYENWEIIVSDDGSTDETLNIIEAYQKKCPGRIKLLDKNYVKGACGNFFHLLKQADAEYIMFCDQDDFWEKDKIELSLSQIKKLEQEYGKMKPVLIYTDLVVTDAKLNIISDSFMRYSKLDAKRNSLNQLMIQNVVTGCTMMINSVLREMAVKYGDMSNIIMHDWWIALTASAFGKIDYLNKKTVRYRQHERNEIGAKKFHDILGMLKKALTGRGLRKSLEDTVLQTKRFYDTYKNIMSHEQNKMVLDYSRLYEYTKLKRISILFKYRIFKYGLLRIIGQIVWI